MHLQDASWFTSKIILIKHQFYILVSFGNLLQIFSFMCQELSSSKPLAKPWLLSMGNLEVSEMSERGWEIWKNLMLNSDFHINAYF